MLFYREIAPHPQIKHLVFSFWEFTVSPQAAAVSHEIFPDGCISLFYHRNDNFKIETIGISALGLESIVVPVFPSDIFWGMRIAPAICAKILRSDPAEVTSMRQDKSNFYPHLTENLVEKFNACQNFDEAIEVYSKLLESLDLSAADADQKMVEAVRIIEETGGEIKVSELAGKLNLSPRQLERRFKNCSGLTPKQFIRVRRIRATAVNLVENENLNWAGRAAEMGFTDQAHLAHEFVSLTRRSPNSFAKRVKQIEHGNLVKNS